MSEVETLLIWADAILSLMFITSVWRQQILSRIAQSIGVGAAVGHAILIAIDTIYRTGISSVIGGKIITLIGLILGVLMFGRFTKYKWLARYPTQIVMSTGLGVMFGLGITTQIFGQISASVGAVFQPADSFALLNGILILIGLITTLGFFLFTFPGFVITQRTTGWYGITRRIARIYIMIAFGITFAGEEIWYLTMFIGRLWLLWRQAVLPALGMG
jgi:hypothetical protein